MTVKSIRPKLKKKTLDSLHTILCFEGHEMGLDDRAGFFFDIVNTPCRHFLFGKNRSLIFVKFGTSDGAMILRIHDDVCYYSFYYLSGKPEYFKSGNFKVEKPDVFEDWIDGFMTLAGSKLTDKMRLTPEEAKSIEKILGLVTE